MNVNLISNGVNELFAGIMSENINQGILPIVGSSCLAHRRYLRLEMDLYSIRWCPKKEYMRSECLSMASWNSSLHDACFL